VIEVLIKYFCTQKEVHLGFKSNNMEQNKPELTDASKALDIALELIKQLITLSSGILAISATFLPKINEISILSFIILAVAWLALILSIIAGSHTISIMVNSQINGDMEWYSGSGQLYGKACKWLFIIGLATFTIFAISMIVSGQPSDPESTSGINNVFN
jgi:hypothetical protein